MKDDPLNVTCQEACLTSNTGENDACMAAARLLLRVCVCVCLSSNLLFLQSSPGNAWLGKQDATLAPRKFYSALHDEEDNRQDNDEQPTKSHCNHSTNNLDSDWRGETTTTCM